MPGEGQANAVSAIVSAKALCNLKKAPHLKKALTPTLSPQAGRGRTLRNRPSHSPILSPPLFTGGDSCVDFQQFVNWFECFFRTLLDRWASSTHQARQQHHDKDDQEDEKQYFRDARRSERDSTKAQKTGYDRDYEKHQRPIEHTLLR
jgi:hypothetical protein